MTAMALVAVAFPLVLVLAGIAYQSLNAARDAVRFPAPGRLVDRRLHVVCKGSGEPTVVFDAAIAASSLSWTRVQADVARFAATCAYDRAGLGWSRAPAERPTFDRTVDDLIAVLAAAAPAAPYVLVGHSFGAFVCLEYAARHPQQVAGLVLVDPPSEWMRMDRRQRHMLRGGIAMSRLGGLLARIGVVRASLALLTGGAPSATRHFVKVFGPTTARTLTRLVGEIRKLPEEIHPQLQAIWCQPKCFAAMADHLRMMGEATEAVGRIRSLGDVPVVVMSSGDQPPAVADAHRALAETSSRGRVVVARKSGHWIAYDEPELIVAAIRTLVVTSVKVSGETRDVTDNTVLKRFELTVDGQTAFLAYHRTVGSMTLIHTEVPESLRGHHLGDVLVKAALDTARREGRQVVPLCPFVKAYLRKHPD